MMLLAGCDLLKPPIEYGIEYGRNHIKTPHGTAWIGDTYDGVKLIMAQLSRQKFDVFIMN